MYKELLLFYNIKRKSYLYFILLINPRGGGLTPILAPGHVTDQK